ncbi:hypothetical protein KL929_002216 [Ogataea haglerorum]|uniref:uncharacterized protein n=1 Tax=Ogataea haglerorum TaxID=1937702 RepID=UPI001C8937B0|nr:uncharacterized protein KL911_001990 [Ogataea haglerorum]KAG7754551.1 hypothetical protein KL911_001990 [Ogataea haglerorum]KAG7798251.1 hypothetical protein KL929_002216 [Ogataea haglerorum]
MTTLIRNTRTVYIGIRSFRPYHSLVERIRSEVQAHPIYIVCLPITTKKSFFFCQYTPKVLPDGKEGLDTKLVNWAAKAWHKLERSENRFNKSIVSVIHRLLNEIPWMETCFRSIPSQTKITRYLKDYQKPDEKTERTSDQDRKVHPGLVTQLDISPEELEQIPLYYPSLLLSSEQITKELRSEIQKGHEYHKKYLFVNLLLLPLTIPFALIPVIPNVPGFYLAYRSYCHLTALNGVKHLRFLLDLKGGEEHHLQMIGLQDAHDLFIESKDESTRISVLEHIKKGDLKEKLLLDEGSITNICKAFGIEKFEPNLHVALYQERKRLSREGLERSRD